LAIVSCGNGSAVGPTPRPLRELVTVAQRTSAGHARISSDRLGKAISCPADSTIFTSLDGARENLGEAAKLLVDAKAKVSIGKSVLTSQTKIAKGDNFRNCTANEPFEVRSYSTTLHLEAQGHSDDTEDTGDVIQLDGRWFALLKR
jgi:hypothetical protein